MSADQHDSPDLSSPPAGGAGDIGGSSNAGSGSGRAGSTQPRRHDLHRPGDSRALRPAVYVGVGVVVAALLFLFVQLAADIVQTARNSEFHSYGGSSGSYMVGLAMLVIGAAMLMTAAVASRPRPPPSCTETEPVPSPKTVSDTTSSSSEAELSVKLRAGPEAAARATG